MNLFMATFWIFYEGKFAYVFTYAMNLLVVTFYSFCRERLPYLKDYNLKISYGAYKWKSWRQVVVKTVARYKPPYDYILKFLPTEIDVCKGGLQLPNHTQCIQIEKLTTVVVKTVPRYEPPYDYILKFLSREIGVCTGLQLSNLIRCIQIEVYTISNGKDRSLLRTSLWLHSAISVAVDWHI